MFTSIGSLFFVYTDDVMRTQPRSRMADKKTADMLTGIAEALRIASGEVEESALYTKLHARRDAATLKEMAAKRMRTQWEKTFGSLQITCNESDAVNLYSSAILAQAIELGVIDKFGFPNNQVCKP